MGTQNKRGSSGLARPYKVYYTGFYLEMIDANSFLFEVKSIMSFLIE